jgi:hypothetical protein
MARRSRKRRRFGIGHRQWRLLLGAVVKVCVCVAVVGWLLVKCDPSKDLDFLADDVPPPINDGDGEVEPITYVAGLPDPRPELSKQPLGITHL